MVQEQIKFSLSSDVKGFYINLNQIFAQQSCRQTMYVYGKLPFKTAAIGAFHSRFYNANEWERLHRTTVQGVNQLLGKLVTV
jgi:hypothetical protein